MLVYTDMNRFRMFLLHLWVFMTKNVFVANIHSCVRMIVDIKRARNKTIK